MQIHIRNLFPFHPINETSVNDAFVIQGLWQFSGCDRNIFHDSEHISKLKADKFHIIFFHQPKYIFLRQLFHSIPLFFYISHVLCLLPPNRGMGPRKKGALPMISHQKNALAPGHYYSNAPPVCQRKIVPMSTSERFCFPADFILFASAAAVSSEVMTCTPVSMAFLRIRNPSLECSAPR